MAHPDTRPISFTYQTVASMWVVILHSPFLYFDSPLTCHPPSCWLRLFSSQTFSHINTSTLLKRSHSSYLPAYEDGTDRVFQNVGIQIQMPGNYPEESIQLQKNWRNWICHMVFLILLVWKLETVTDMMSRVLCVCRQQCHLLECGLFCGHYDSRYCWEWHAYILYYVCTIQSCFFCFTDSLPLTSCLVTHTVADISDLGCLHHSAWFFLHGFWTAFAVLRYCLCLDLNIVTVLSKKYKFVFSYLYLPHSSVTPSFVCPGVVLITFISNIYFNLSDQVLCPYKQKAKEDFKR